MKLKEQVEYVLKTFPKSRDSDTYLTLKIWVSFYGKYIDNTNTLNPKVDFQTILNILPNQDGVKRIRAMFQNDMNMYLPTNIRVVKARRINEEKWLEFIRDNSEYKRL